MKLLKSLLLLAATLMTSSIASAQVSPNKNVVVDANLTGACVFETAAALNLTANYPAFTTSAVEPQGTVNVQCTRGGTNTPSINFAGGTLGVVGGLVFELSATWTGGGAGTAPAGSLLADLGTPATGTFAVKASFPAGQAGTNGTTSAVTRAMTISF